MDYYYYYRTTVIGLLFFSAVGLLKSQSKTVKTIRAHAESDWIFKNASLETIPL
jgi:hypothetical protein